jgi:hypothetical protein
MEKPFLTAFSNKDSITASGERLFQKLIPAPRTGNIPPSRMPGIFCRKIRVKNWLRSSWTSFERVLS